MKTKVETGVMQLQAKQCEAPPEAESGPWADRTTPRLWLGGPRGRCQGHFNMHSWTEVSGSTSGCSGDMYLCGSPGGSVAERSQSQVTSQFKTEVGWPVTWA